MRIIDRLFGFVSENSLGYFERIGKMKLNLSKPCFCLGKLIYTSVNLDSDIAEMSRVYNA